MTKQIQVEVSSVTYDVMVKLTDLVAQLKKAAADGISVADIPVAVSACIQDLLPAIAELNQIPAEAKANLVPFERAIALGAGDLLQVVLS